MTPAHVVRQRGADRIVVGSVARRAIDAPPAFALGSVVRLRTIVGLLTRGMRIVARWRGLAGRTLERGRIVPWLLHGGARLWFATGEPDTCRVGRYAAGRAHDVPR